MSYDPTLTPENIFWRILNERFKGRWSLITHKISSIISGTRRELPDGHYLRNYFNTILPTRNDFGGNKDKCLAIWTCKSKIDQIEIIVNGDKYVMHNEIEGDYSEMSFFSHLPKGIEIGKIILLSINSEKIEPYIIEDLDGNYWEYNYHEEWPQ
jgi:hypothetical protein